MINLLAGQKTTIDSRRSQHSPTSIKVTLGDYILNSDIESIPHEVFSVVGVLLHPNFRFTPQADRYDVAVLELDRTAVYKDNIKPICLPPKDSVFVGKTAYVAGWGALQAGEYLDQLHRDGTAKLCWLHLAWLPWIT